MSISSISASYANLRIGGLASGLDTDSIIENLMNIEQIKVDSLEQKKQIQEWKQEAYREITQALNEFESEQYNVIDPSSNILSDSSYKAVDVNCAGVENISRYLEIIVNGDAVNGNYTINGIDQLAAAASAESTAGCIQNVTGTADLSSGTITTAGTSFKIRLDGVQKTIEFDSDYADTATFLTALQDKVDTAFGTGRINVSLDDGKYVSFSSDNSVIQFLSGDETDSLDVFGITAGAQNRVSLNDSFLNVFGEENNISFSINGVDFSFSNEETISNVLEEINDSNAGVTMRYSSLTDTFSITSNETGSGSQILIENTSGNLFGASSYINITDSIIRNGQDAVFYLNDETKSNPIKRSSNVFTIDGVTYSLKDTINDDIELNIYNDVDSAYEKIESYIEKYNEVIELINNKIDEDQYMDYQPLTDSQKEEMTEDEIEIWEAKAKSGLLRNDSILRTIASRLREAFYTGIDGTSENFFNAGISSAGYEEKGKLTINESQLRTVLEENVEDVMELFAKSSDIDYSADLTSAQRSQRFNESGFAQRVSDIINDNTRITRDENGYKGILLEKAGIENDITETDNMLSDAIGGLDEQIADAIESMNAKENEYWRQFTALEQAINQMNSQSSWLASMLGTNE